MTKKLTRITNDKMVAGVAAGLAQYFQLDVTWVRIAFALAAFFGGGGLWIYIILWIAVPEETNPLYTYTDYRVNPDEPLLSDAKAKNKNSMNLIGGILLIGFGSYFLLDEFDIIPNWFRLGKLWPLIFVFIGLSVFLKGIRKENVPNDINPKEEAPKQPEETTEPVKQDHTETPSN